MKSPSSKKKWILLGVAVALTLCCCLPVGTGGAVIWYSRQWKEFTSTEGRFSVLMPGRPTYSKLGQGTHQHIFQSPGFGAFNASYLDDLPSEEEAILRFALIVGKPDMVLMADYPGSTLVSQQAIKLGPYTGHEFVLDTPVKVRVVKRLYLVKKRVYVLTTAKVSDANRTRFFDSFKVTEP